MPYSQTSHVSYRLWFVLLFPTIDFFQLGVDLGVKCKGFLESGKRLLVFSDKLHIIVTQYAQYYPLESLRKESISNTRK